jgi:hypothetical protein
MKKAVIAAAMLAVGLGIGAPAAADPGAFEWLMKQADLSRDGAVTKQQFLDAMSKAYDQAMAKMQNDPKKVKGGMMTMDGLRELFADLYRGS